MPDIKPLNHPTGLLDVATLEPVIVSGEPFAELSAVGTEIHTAVFEVPYAQAQALLPPSLHPTTVGYATLTSFRVPESAIGAFEFSVMGVACRSVIRPRMLTLSCFASTERAVAALREQWGFPAKLADVRTRMRYDAARTKIVLDGRTIAEAVSSRPEMLQGSSRAIRYPQALNPVRLGGKDGLLQFDIRYEYDESFRGVLSLPVFDAAAMTGGKLHPTDMIAGNYVKLVSTQFLAPRLGFDLSVVGKLFAPEEHVVA